MDFAKTIKGELLRILFSVLIFVAMTHLFRSACLRFPAPGPNHDPIDPSLIGELVLIGGSMGICILFFFVSFHVITDMVCDLAYPRTNK